MYRKVGSYVVERTTTPTLTLVLVMLKGEG